MIGLIVHVHIQPFFQQIFVKDQNAFNAHVHADILSF